MITFLVSYFISSQFIELSLLVFEDIQNFGFWKIFIDFMLKQRPNTFLG